MARATSSAKRYMSQKLVVPDLIISAQRQQGGVVDDLRGELRLHRKDMLLQPLHQGQVVGQAPEAGHGRMGMDVDQAGHDQAVFFMDASRALW